MRVRLAAVIAGALLVAACTDTNSPVAPELLANRSYGPGDHGVSDQTFSWLPPIFDGFTGWRFRNVEGLAPEVQIFACIATEGPACDELGAQIADLPASDGSGDGTWHESRNHYLATWKLDEDLAGDTYRMCVGLPQDGGGLTYLGHADVQVVNPRHRGKHGWGASGHEGDWHDRGTTVLAGSTLPVKFKIGDGYQTATADAGCPAADPPTATLAGTVGVSVYGNMSPVMGVTITVFDASGNQVGDQGSSDASGAYTLSFPGPTAPTTYTVCLGGTANNLIGVTLENADQTNCLSGYGRFLTVNPGDSPTLDFVFLLMG